MHWEILVPYYIRKFEMSARLKILIGGLFFRVCGIAFRVCGIAFRVCGIVPYDMREICDEYN